MNYLAHIYLSGEEEGVIVGNFIGDHVKGKMYEKFPAMIKKGILLHRQIDSFTDSHNSFRETRKLFRDDFGLYSGIITDLIYDHFLARNWHTYSLIPLRVFTKRIHAILLSHFFYLPARVQGFLPFLIQNRRLESYASVKGIKDSLEIMSRHTSLPGKSGRAIAVLHENSDFIEDHFHRFMHNMTHFVETGHGMQLPAKKTASQPLYQACITK